VTPSDALAFIREHGVVLESARGPVPSLAEAIAGEPVRGSWWSHPRSRTIFAVTRMIRESDDILVCRLVDGKVTFVHRRLWPALVRMAHRIPAERLAQIADVHSASGAHEQRQVAFPGWVPASVTAEAAKLSEQSASAQLGMSIEPG
jgi:hypothetical protein